MVREVMTPETTYCYENQTVDEAVRALGDRQIHRLAILNRDDERV